MTNNKTTFTDKELMKVRIATTVLRKAFIKEDTAWKACGKRDTMGIYRFLTGRNSHTMSHLFERFKKSIAMITLYGEYQIETTRKLQRAA